MVAHLDQDEVDMPYYPRVNDLLRAQFQDVHFDGFHMIGGEADMPITDAMVDSWTAETFYSEKYEDSVFEYRRVTVPRAMLPFMPSGRTMGDHEWREMGIVMSRGWEHYEIYPPELNVLLFRRPLGTDGRSGKIPPMMAEKVKERLDHVQLIENELRNKRNIQIRA